MAIVLLHVGAEILLGIALNGVTKQSCKLRLFTAITGDSVDNDDDSSDFTEAAAAGYAAQALALESWTVWVGNGATKTYITFAQQTFTMTGAGDAALGYYITEDGGDEALWAEEFATEESIYNGKVIKITPRFELSTAS